MKTVEIYMVDLSVPCKDYWTIRELETVSKKAIDEMTQNMDEWEKSHYSIHIDGESMGTVYEFLNKEDIV